MMSPDRKQLRKTIKKARKTIGGAGKSALAGAAAAAMTAGSFANSMKDRAQKLKVSAFQKTEKPQEVITMKKSTLVALLVALAAVAGVLGALYVYVLRREKELDEYEQLLFSEDFNDDLPEDMAEDEDKD